MPACIGSAGKRQLHGGQQIASLIRHGPRAVDISATGFGARSRSGTLRRLLFDLAHAQAAPGAAIGVGGMRPPFELHALRT